MSLDDIDPHHLLSHPPDLTREIAAVRYSEINLLLHSIILLGGELGCRSPLLPLLRAAATISSAEKALLFRWDGGLGGLRPAASLGFSGLLPAAAEEGNRQARACLLHRKPVMVSFPLAPTRRGEALARELAELDAEAALSVPLMSGGMPWGALQVLRALPYHRDDAVLLWLFALALEGTLPELTGAGRHPGSRPGSTRPGGR